jgi:Gpi18-like mannosyltransferase
MAALYHLNPLQDTPSRAFGDPFYRFSAWRQVPSAYGPIWEMLAQVSVQVIGSSDRTLNVIGFKLLNTVGYGLCAVLIALTLRRLAPRRALVGVYLWLWNPLVVYMSSGTGHNDVVMTACLAAAVYCVVRRWYVAGTLMAVLGALIKFIPILLLPVIVIVALRRLGWRRWLRYMAVASLLGGALLVAAYAPYWHGWETLRVERRALMYTGSVATVMRYFLVPAFDQVAFNTSSTKTPVTNALLANGTIILFGLFYLIQLIQLWREREAMTFIRVCARLLLCYLLVASLWFYAWYVIWALALAALLEDTPVRRLVMRFSYLVTWQALFYNYLAVATKGGAWLPWLDLTPVSLYMGYAWGYTGHFLLTSWLRQRRQSADDEQVGRRLAEARQSAGLSLGELSDDLAIRYEVLEQYERGERALRFDHGRLLAQRLRLPLDALLGTKA